MSHITIIPSLRIIEVSLGRYWCNAGAGGINIGWKRPVDGTYRRAQITVRWTQPLFDERYGYRKAWLRVPITRHGVRVFVR